MIGEVDSTQLSVTSGTFTVTLATQLFSPTEIT
jgi:hypothetical protein